MKNFYGAKRFIAEYERRVNSDIQEFTNDLDFHIEQLTEAINEMEKALDVIGDEIADWGECIAELYEDMEDEDTLWNRIQIYFLRKYVNWRYAKVLDEAVEIGNIKERLERIRNRFLIILSCR